MSNGFRWIILFYHWLLLETNWKLKHQCYQYEFQKKTGFLFKTIICKIPFRTLFTGLTKGRIDKHLVKSTFYNYVP